MREARGGRRETGDREESNALAAVAAARCPAHSVSCGKGRVFGPHLSCGSSDRFGPASKRMDFSATAPFRMPDKQLQTPEGFCHGPYPHVALLPHHFQPAICRCCRTFVDCETFLSHSFRCGLGIWSPLPRLGGCPSEVRPFLTNSDLLYIISSAACQRNLKSWPLPLQHIDWSSSRCDLSFFASAGRFCWVALGWSARRT